LIPHNHAGYDRRVPVAPGSRDELPLSFNQSGYLTLEWLAHLRSQPRPSGPISIGLVFDGPVNPGALERALNAVVQRHEVLRTSFADPCRLTAAQERTLIEQLSANDWSPTGVFGQRVHQSASVSIAVESVPHGLDDRAELAWLKEQIFTAAIAPFAYGQPPLIRAVLYRRPSGRHLLVLLVNHLVADGWSIGIVRRELELFYDAEITGMPADLPELPLQFGDFAAWQRNRFAEPMPDADVAYWRQHLTRHGSCLLRPSELRIRRDAPAVQRHGPGCESLVLGADLVQRLGAAGRRYRLTTYMLCTAAAVALFHAYTGRSRMSWWGFCSNRPSLETENLIRWFAQGRVLGIDVSPDDTGLQLFAKVQESVCDMYDHDDVPIHVVWKMLGGREIEFGDAFNREFVSFDLAVLRPPAVVTLADGVVVSAAPRDLLATWNRPSLGLWVSDAAPDLIVGCRYALEEFDRSVMQRLVQDWVRLLGHLARAPEAPLARVLGRLSSVDRTPQPIANGAIA
jgi:hypothetical protein